jgi:predicted transcriptional regulator
MNSHPSAQLTQDEIQRLAEDIIRLGRNPVLEKIITQPVGGDLLSEQKNRKAAMKFLAQQELSRRALVQRSLPHAISHEAAWLVILDLFVHRDDPQGVSVKGASLASGLRSTTALRYIDKLESAGFIAAEWSDDDRRRKMVTLTPEGLALVTRTLLDLENLVDPLEQPDPSIKHKLK